MDEKKRDDLPEEYEEPKVEEWGSVAEATQTGLTMPGTDLKAGSAASQGI